MSASILLILLTYVVSLLASALLTVTLLISARNKIPGFVSLNVVVFLWLLLQFIIQFFAPVGAQESLMRLTVFTAGALVPSLLWVLDSVIPAANTLLLRVLAVSSLLLGIINALPITSFQINASKEGIAVSSSSPLYPLMLIVVFVSLAVMYYQVWTAEKQNAKLKPSNDKAYKSFRYALLSMLALNLVGAFVLAQYKWSQILAPLSMVMMAQWLAVSIFKQNLIYVRQFAARATTYLALYIATVGLFILASLAILNQTILRNQHATTIQMLSYSCVALLLAIVQPTLHKLFDKLTDLFFYRYTYDPQVLLNDLNDRLIGQVEVEKLSSILVKRLSHHLKLSFVAISTTDGGFRASKQRDLETLRILAAQTSAIQFDIITFEEAESKHRTRELAELMKNADISVIASIRDGAEHIGNIYYSSKLSGDSFHSKDLQLMQIISDQVLLVLQNALKFEKIAQFNETLQEEVARATARLQHANEKLKVLDKLKDDFLSMASHQFRTPAGSIRQAFKMIHDPNLTKKDRDEVLMLAEANSEQLVSLVNTMLNISRIEAGRFTIDRSLTDMPALLDKVILATDIVAQQKHIKLDFQRPDHTILMEVDRAKINEAMKNYIENAIKYSSDDSTIDISLRQDSALVYFEVRDSGMGVPQKDQHNLFNKFYRAGNARELQPDGNGIGLYVVKEIVEGHGGKVYYEPLPSRGSLFGFSLPVQQPHHHATQPE